MKKRYVFLIILMILMIIIIMVLTLPLIINKYDSLIMLNTEEVTSINITEYKTQSVEINKKDDVEKLLKELEKIRVTKSFWHITKVVNWKFRVSIYGPTMLKENFYLTDDGKVYTNKFVYTVDDFNYDYFLGLLKQQ